jgi:hypothetical protein
MTQRHRPAGRKRQPLGHDALQAHFAAPGAAARFRTPRASQPQHQRAERGERVPVDLTEIDCPACASPGRTRQNLAKQCGWIML